MSETPIADAVENALCSALAEQDSMLTGYFCVAATVDVEGRQGLTIVRPVDQPVHATLGLLAYAQEWFNDDVRYQIACLSEEDE